MPLSRVNVETFSKLFGINFEGYGKYYPTDEFLNSMDSFINKDSSKG